MKPLVLCHGGHRQAVTVGTGGFETDSIMNESMSLRKLYVSAKLAVLAHESSPFCGPPIRIIAFIPPMLQLESRGSATL